MSVIATDHINEAEIFQNGMVLIVNGARTKTSTRIDAGKAQREANAFGALAAAMGSVVKAFSNFFFSGLEDHVRITCG